MSLVALSEMLLSRWTLTSLLAMASKCELLKLLGSRVLMEMDCLI